jgi:hypothetical protein
VLILIKTCKVTGRFSILAIHDHQFAPVEATHDIVWNMMMRNGI